MHASSTKASMDNAPKSDSRLALREGKRKLSPLKNNTAQLRKEGNKGYIGESPFLAQGPSHSGPLSKFHPGAEEGLESTKLSSSASIKGKKDIARARAHQTGIRMLERPNSTPLPQSNTNTVLPKHDELIQPTLREMQIATGGGLGSGFQFRGGEMRKNCPGNGAGKIQSGEGARGTMPTNGEERRKAKGNIGRIGGEERVPIHMGGVVEVKRGIVGEDVLHGEKGDHNFDSNNPAIHGDHFAHGRSEMNVGNDTTSCDIDVGQGDQMLLEDEGEGSVAF